MWILNQQPKEPGEPFSYFRDFDSILHAEAYFLNMSPPGLTQVKPAAFYPSILPVNDQDKGIVICTCYANIACLCNDITDLFIDGTLYKVLPSVIYCSA
jgi:hypothetical protein